jgi:hypothetical protein
VSTTRAENHAIVAVRCTIKDLGELELQMTQVDHLSFLKEKADQFNVCVQLQGSVNSANVSATPKSVTTMNKSIAIIKVSTSIISILEEEFASTVL